MGMILTFEGLAKLTMRKTMDRILTILAVETKTCWHEVKKMNSDAMLTWKTVVPQLKRLHANHD